MISFKVITTEQGIEIIGELNGDKLRAILNHRATKDDIKRIKDNITRVLNERRKTK